MLDPENEGFGLDMYNSKVQDPLLTNSINASITEDLT